jgi:hypothetical protein
MGAYTGARARKSGNEGKFCINGLGARQFRGAREAQSEEGREREEKQ